SRALAIQLAQALRGQWMACAQRNLPPAHGFSAIRRLPGVAFQGLHPQLVSSLAIAVARSQTQQAQALLARAQALATKQQDMTVETLGADMPQVRHARILPLHPLPGSWL